MDRKRILEIILAVVCVVSIPGYLINLYLSRLNAASAPGAPASDPRFNAAFDAGVALEQGKQYPEAISKFLEAEMYAGKMQSGKYAALETAIEHYRSCNTALGQQDEVHAASKQLMRTLFEEGESLRNAGQLEASVPKFQQVEEGAQDIHDFEVPMEDLARQRLVEVLWKLKRYSDVDAVSDRMIAAVRQPSNDYNSIFGEEYSKIALWRSHLPDWEGTEKACTRAIEEYDKTIAMYPESDSSGRQLTSNARFAKAMAMYWLALAYTNQRKQDFALSAADNAFQYTAQLHSSDQLARQIADLGLQAANLSQQQQLIAIWQKRLKDLPANPCPAPKIGNSNCLTPAATDQPTR